MSKLTKWICFTCGEDNALESPRCGTCYPVHGSPEFRKAAEKHLDALMSCCTLFGSLSNPDAIITVREVGKRHYDFMMEVLATIPGSQGSQEPATPFIHSACGTTPMRYSEDGRPYCLRCHVNIAPTEIPGDPSQKPGGEANRVVDRLLAENHQKRKAVGEPIQGAREWLVTGENIDAGTWSVLGPPLGPLKIKVREVTPTPPGVEVERQVMERIEERSRTIYWSANNVKIESYAKEINDLAKAALHPPQEGRP